MDTEAARTKIGVIVILSIFLGGGATSIRGAVYPANRLAGRLISLEMFHHLLHSYMILYSLKTSRDEKLSEKQSCKNCFPVSMLFTI